MTPPPLKDREPRVTIGMPVYNEARFLEESLASLAAQDYGNFTVEIVDNASTDDTGSIAAAFAARDARFHYRRHDSNIGVAENFSGVADAADGEYFMWAAGHDLWSPNLVSASVAALERDSDASLAVAPSWWIDADGQRDVRDTSYPDMAGRGLVRRFFIVLWGNMHPVLGLMRTSMFRETRNIQSFAGADLVLLTEMNLRGPFVAVPEANWQRRDVRARETHEQRLARYSGDEYGQAKGSLNKRFPLVKLPLALLRAIKDAPQSLGMRVLLMSLAIQVMPLRYLAGRRKANARD